MILNGRDAAKELTLKEDYIFSKNHVQRKMQQLTCSLDTVLGILLVSIKRKDCVY
uniref:Uncharacterized protein n=1 Tax=Arundo donax TaxID=35708 RepID=A0A0A9C167_ARUDO